MSGALLMAAGVARGDWAAPPENIREHVISLKEETPAIKAVREHLTAALAGVKPAAEAVPQIAATAEKGYLLWGDFFKTGTCFALYEPKEKDVENAATLALAEWKEGKWELRGLWKMPLSWMPREEDEGKWSGPEGYCDPQNTVHMPFELKDLIADGVPEVIVSGEKTKYHQAMYVMKFNKESHGLDLLTYSMKKPEKVGKYLRLYDASGNKAIWQEWTFMEWNNNKLSKRAAWYSESPYNNIDPAFDLVRVPDATGKMEEFHITIGSSEEETSWSYEVLKDDKPFAKVTAIWMPGKNQENAELMVGAWLFEKLTGLPREDFPERYGPETADREKLELLEKHANVRVEGNEEAMKRLSTGK